MSAILSADDLNDFISPGVACIKPIETLPKKENDPSNPYEVTTEEKVAADNPAPAQISLTDCLACSGCVTSAEAVLVSLQSHVEVLSTLDAYPSLSPPWATSTGIETNSSFGAQELDISRNGMLQDGKIFVASVSSQVRASLAATFGVSSVEAGNMISHLLSGSDGLAKAVNTKSSFLWTIDTDRLRDAALVLAADEVLSQTPHEPSTNPTKPILTSACPGWICYAEKQHPYLLPHLSRLKSPQALGGTLIKSVLSRQYGISPDKIWHLALMPCFDKKLEASRSELTDAAWLDADESMRDPAKVAIRDVDCVITARELLQLAAARGIDFASLPRTPFKSRIPFPDPTIDAFLFPSAKDRSKQSTLNLEDSISSIGTSGGYLWHILQRAKAQTPGSDLQLQRGRNADVLEYVLIQNQRTIFKAARYYGFRNIQNLVRRLKPAKMSRLPGARAGGARRPGGSAGDKVEYAYVEVMACPGGCTNGGGQIRAGEVETIKEEGNVSGEVRKIGPIEQRAWLGTVDEAYFSASEASDSESEDHVMINAVVGDSEREHHDSPMEIDVAMEAEKCPELTADVVDGISWRYIHNVISHWSSITGIDRNKLVFTSYREVESDVGKPKKSDVERVAGLAATVGGGW